jgi:hypothetical protein
MFPRFEGSPAQIRLDLIAGTTIDRIREERDGAGVTPEPRYTSAARPSNLS